MAAMEYISLEY